MKKIIAWTVAAGILFVPDQFSRHQRRVLSRMERRRCISAFEGSSQRRPPDRSARRRFITRMMDLDSSIRPGSSELWMARLAPGYFPI